MWYTICRSKICLITVRSGGGKEYYHNNLSWLKRPFDIRPQYAFLGTFCGAMVPILIERVIQLPFPKPFPEQWLTPLRVVLVAVAAAVLFFAYLRERNRQHSFARGIGWYSVGMIMGCLMVARLGRDIPQENNDHMFWVAGIIAILLAVNLHTEWKERDLAEE